MDKLSLPATAATPAVDFDAATGVLAISGESYPENAFEFYKPLLGWTATFLRQASR